MLAALSRNGAALCFASDAMKNAKEVVTVSQNVHVLQYALDELLNERFFVLSMKMIGIRKRFRWPLLPTEV